MTTEKFIEGFNTAGFVQLDFDKFDLNVSVYHIESDGTWFRRNMGVDASRNVFVLEEVIIMLRTQIKADVEQWRKDNPKFGMDNLQDI